MKKSFLIFLMLVVFVVTVIVCTIAPSVKFMGKTYVLKWSNIGPTNGYINEYLEANQTFDTYKEMITVHEFPAVKSQKKVAKTIYNDFYANVKSGKAVMADIYPIGNKATIIRYCAVAKLPKLNLECSSYNVQERTKDNSVIMFQFTQRYFLDEVKITPANAEGVINGGYSTIKKDIENVVMPKIVRTKKDAAASYFYGFKSK